MIRIAALNDESGDDTGPEDEVTREALEEIALQQYAKALELQKKGKYEEARDFIKDLLNTEIMHEVQKPETADNVARPLLNMKYLCFRNLASILERLGSKKEAVEAYCDAVALDHTDVTIWYRLGKLSLECEQFNLALHAFQRGAEVNPRHWPCIDSLIMLHLGLSDYNSCIVTIYDALQLDPDYLRGRAYRKYINANHDYVIEFLSALDPKYKYNIKEDEDVDKDESDALIAQAMDINKKYIDQVALNTFTPIMPVLTLEKPIAEFTWESVGSSLVHMHKYMYDKMLSHACVVEIKMKEKDVIMKDDKIAVDNTVKSPAPNPDENMEEPKQVTAAENETTPDDPKMDIDAEAAPIPEKDDAENKMQNDIKENKKVIRRRNSLSSLGMWDWCKTKVKPAKKKPKEYDDTLNDFLRRLLPNNMMPPPENKTEDNSTDVDEARAAADLDNEIAVAADPEQYFSSETEKNAVEAFVQKFSDSPADIISMLYEFVEILSKKWNVVWPENLGNFFVESTECLQQHIEPPTLSKEYYDDIKLYTEVILCAAEIKLNDFTMNDIPEPYNVSPLDALSVYVTRPEIYGDDHLNIVLRYLWVQSHALIFNNVSEFALEFLYRMSYELSENDDLKIVLPNFSAKPIIQKKAVVDVIKSLERNENLSKVLSLYHRGEFEEVKSILLDSYPSCQALAQKGEYMAMSLDWAAQLILSLDTLWALDEKEDCFVSATKYLSEALKHYYKFPVGSEDSDKWAMPVRKALVTLDYIIKTEGIYFMDLLSETQLSTLVNDIVKLICHQAEDSNSSELPIKTVTPWILLYYIVQIEEDRGRIQLNTTDDTSESDTDLIPNSFQILFTGHEYLGSRSWCCNNQGQLLYFILDTVIPRIKTPALAPIIEKLSPHIEQVIFCLFGHRNKKGKARFCIDHHVTPHQLDWNRAQQIFDFYNPIILPEFDSSRSASISFDTEQLLQRMLSLIPSELDVKPHVEGVIAYIEGKRDSTPETAVPLPFKMRDIYYLLADYYCKTKDFCTALRYYAYDIIVDKNRFNSWAGMALARASLLETKLSSCDNFKSETEYFAKASAVETCFRRALEIDTTHSTLWIEYGCFVYAVHSFCSRTLKQASESLSMEDFEQLEKRKETMLDTAQKCFMNANDEVAVDCDGDLHDERWLHYYMLGKVAEKKGNPPEKYLSHYMKAIHFLKLNNAEYPLKINYNNPQNLSVELLEIYYRVHASILKYIEQHENKVIYASEGKVFQQYIEKCLKLLSSTNETTKEAVAETAAESTDDKVAIIASQTSELKRPLTEKENDPECKKIKLDDPPALENETLKDIEKEPEPTTVISKPAEEVVRRSSQESGTNAASKDDSSSSSSSESSDSESTSDSSSSSSDSNESQQKPKAEPMTQEQIDQVIGLCLDNLEDCVSRFNQHYKALYRLAHYHFYSRRGKNMERCRDSMLGSFVGRNGTKLQGLFCERKNSNFFSNVWRIPVSEIDRPGSFASHMSRCVLIIMEVLKEIDDHKTLLELNIQLQRTPELDKKYLRDSEREELAQQALTLCVQSLKGQLTKFCHQSDVLSNPVEKHALSRLILDIYRAYQKVQKSSPSKASLFGNLLIDGYKLISSDRPTELTNPLEASIKYCQSMIMNLKQQATILTNQPKKPPPPKPEAKVTTIPASTFLPFNNKPTIPPPPPPTTKSSYLNYFPTLDPALLSVLANPTTLSYMTELGGGYPSFSDLSPNYQTELLRQFMSPCIGSPTYIPPSSAPFQSTIPKPKIRATKPKAPPPKLTQPKPSKSMAGYSMPYQPRKTAPKDIAKTFPPTVPQSMMTTKPSYSNTHMMYPMVKPAHISTTSTTNAVLHAKPPLPHQQVSPGKTLQEKLAEKQKLNPAMSKPSISISVSHEVASSFSGKIPSALTITKSSGASSIPSVYSRNEEIKKKQNQAKGDDLVTQEIRRSLQFDEDKTKMAKKSSDVIVLDDD